MALTRKLLKGMGLNDEQIDTLIEAHTETVDGLKEQITKYKGDAEKLPGVQKELDELKTAGDGGYKEKYEKEKKDFEDFKTAQAAKEARTAKEKAYRELLKTSGVSEKRIDAIMKVTNLDEMEMDGEKLKDEENLSKTVKLEWADFITTEGNQGANTSNPPKNENGGETDLGNLSMADYIAARTKKG